MSFLTPPKKVVWRKIKLATGLKIPWPRYTKENQAKKKKWPVSDDFGLRKVKEPVVQNPFQTKIATSVVAPVMLGTSSSTIGGLGWG